MTKVVKSATASLGGIVTEKDDEGALRHAFVIGSDGQANRVTGNEPSVMGEPVKVCDTVPVLMTDVKNTEVVPTGAFMPAGREDAAKLALLPPPTPGTMIKFQTRGGNPGTIGCWGS